MPLSDIPIGIGMRELHMNQNSYTPFVVIYYILNTKKDPELFFPFL